MYLNKKFYYNLTGCYKNVKTAFIQFGALYIAPYRYLPKVQKEN